MKRIVVCLLLLFAADSGFGRNFRVWTQREMYQQADLIVVARPISTQATAERGVMPHLNNFNLVDLSTELQVETVLKGDKTLKQFVLHHYGLATKYEPGNAPQLVPFGYDHTTGNCTKPDCATSYLLYLKKEADGRYAPVDGQVDPAFSSITKLPQGWKMEDLKVRAPL
ncbi:MAG: hypothetical protein NT105_17880 [Verrucomicrobia bacterium]|nr:hypothetical protein [Verrucomicrobiota bacterium]